MAVASNVRYDVAVIGGGAAGLSGALALARATRSVVVIDSGRPRNAAAEGVHGFLTRDGISPSEFIVLTCWRRRCPPTVVTVRTGHRLSAPMPCGRVVGLEDGEEP
jgi:glycine/D-amino acid oxidase-like deaminating enzyme